MIIGDYYINNFLVLGIIVLLFGGLAFMVVPGPDNGSTGPEENSSESYEFLVSGEGLQAGSSHDVTLVNDGRPVSDVSVLLNGEEVGTTGEDGSVTFEAPDQSTVTVSASVSQVDVEQTLEVEASQDQEDGSGEDEGSDNSDGDNSGEDGSDNNSGDDSNNQGENSTEDSDDQENTNQSLEPSIDRLSPDSQQLESTGFEASYRFRAENASYRILLGGDEKASGEIDGERTITGQLTVSANGTVDLRAELLREDETLASDTYTLNYSADTGSEDSEDGSSNDSDDGTTDPAQVTAGLTAPSSVQVGNQVELDASGSSGDIINYTWTLGDETTQTTESPTLTHTYSSEGTYEVKVTVNGENNTQDNATTNLEVQGLQEPVINFISPVNNYETDQASISYEFEVNNSATDAEYSILIDGSSTASGGLNQGNNTVQQTVEVPETVFNTSIQVTQNGETYTSEKRTVNASEAGAPQPGYALNSPQEGDTIETMDSQTSVEFEYEITDRKWATSANLTVTRDGNKVEERPVSVAAGSYTEQVSDLEPGSYSYEIQLTDGENTDSKSKAFSIQQVQPEYSVSLVNPGDGAQIGEENPDDFQNVDFNVSYETDTDAKVNFEIIALESGSNTYTTDDGSGGEQEWTTEYNEGEIVANASTEVLEGMDYHKVFENTFDVELRYEWRSWITVDGEEEKTTEFRTLNITEEPS